MWSERLELPGYEIHGVLGQGGFATVYRASQLAVGREVALKVDSRTLSSPRDRQRFLREVTAAGQLSGHPHVVSVYDAGVLADDRPYMVLELCPGGSLGDRLLRGGPLSVAEACDVGVAVGGAVAAAHAAGVLHRDIKPGNIMVDRFGAVALTDFGLAAMPRPGRELSVTREALTPAYAPPEAFHLAEPTPAGDVYSLAATVYALLRGRPLHFPEDGGQLSIAELIVRHAGPYPGLPGVPAALDEVLGHALAADPAHRMPDAGTLRDALAAVRADTVRRTGHVRTPSTAATVPARRDTPPPWDRAGTSAFPTTLPGAPLGPDGSGPAVAVTRSGAGPAAVVTPPDGTDPVAAVTRPDGRKPDRRRRYRLIAVLAAVSVSVSVSFTVITYQNRSSDTSTDKGTGEGTGKSARTGGSDASSGASTGADAAFAGTPTSTRDCPAAGVEGVGGRCVTTPECWSGITDISGSVTVSRADCQVKHVWETFAIARLPEDGMTNNARDLIRHPDVRALCARDIALRSRSAAGREVTVPWRTDIVPPSAQEWADGLRVFRCVAAAGTDDGEITGSHFGAAG
ncbi:serine/threonine-protein kinase [Streptomyces sp. NPDC005574]|uniref:serine/threonine-protein kinase n=1 Tax=Streptomyces sp. NPDC005574 TaxID=3156891 RepID=UPI00339F6E06